MSLATVAPVARLSSLTGMRFAAAAVVFAHHLLVLMDDSTRLAAEPFLLQGRTGVSFFFVLSGFVLTWARRDGDRVSTFYQRRLARVVPAHLVVWAAVALLLVANGATVRGSWLPSLLLLQPWSDRLEIYFAVNGVAWSLGCELFFYAAFPLLIRLAGRMTQRGRAMTLAAVLTLVLLVAASVSGAVEAGSLGYWIVYIAPPVRILEFVVGVLLALHLSEGRGLPLGVAAASALVVASYLAAGYLPESYGFAAVTLVPYALLIGALASRDLTGRPTVAGGSTAVVLGTWSFAFYLVHQRVLLEYSEVVFGSTAPALGWGGVVFHGGVTLLLSLAVAAAVHRLIERPAERWLRPRAAVLAA